MQNIFLCLLVALLKVSLCFNQTPTLNLPVLSIIWNGKLENGEMTSKPVLATTLGKVESSGVNDIDNVEVNFDKFLVSAIINRRGKKIKNWEEESTLNCLLVVFKDETTKGRQLTFAEKKKFSEIYDELNNNKWWIGWSCLGGTLVAIAGFAWWLIVKKGLFMTSGKC